MPRPLNRLIAQVENLDLDKYVGTTEEYIVDNINRELEMARLKFNEILSDMGFVGALVSSELRRKGVTIKNTDAGTEIENTPLQKEKRTIIVTTAKTIAESEEDTHEQISRLLSNIIVAANETPNVETPENNTDDTTDDTATDAEDTTDEGTDEEDTTAATTDDATASDVTTTTTTPTPAPTPAASTPAQPKKGFWQTLDEWTAWLDWRSEKFFLSKFHNWKQ